MSFLSVSIPDFMLQTAELHIHLPQPYWFLGAYRCAPLSLAISQTLMNKTTLFWWTSAVAGVA